MNHSNARTAELKSSNANPLKIEPLPDISKHTLATHPHSSTIPKHPYRLMISGSSGSGKTNLLLNLILSPQFYRDFFKNIIVISPNVHNDLSYKHLEKYVESTLKRKKKSERVRYFVYATFDSNEMMEIMDDLAAAKQSLGDKLPPTLFVLDDVIDDKHFLNSKFFSMMWTRSRHFNCSAIVCSQSYMRVPRTARLNMTNVVLFKPANASEIKRVYDELVIDMSYDVFEKLCELVYSEKYKFMVFNMLKPTERLYIGWDYIVSRSKAK
jgi:hypothetical protein